MRTNGLSIIFAWLNQMKSLNLFLLFLLCDFCTVGQITYPKDDPKINNPSIYAFTNAVIHVNSSKTIENATLIIEKSRIFDIGKNITIPKNAFIIDLKGKHIYPSFIDEFSSYAMPEVKRSQWSPIPQYETSKKGTVNWNETIHPETNAIDLLKNDANTAKDLRNIGFGTVLTHAMDGIMRGSGVINTLHDAKEISTVIKSNFAQFYSFKKGSSQQAYPSSLMGSIALIRQTLYDAQWYNQSSTKTESNTSLEAIHKHNNTPIIFDAADKYNIIRAEKIAKEFNLKFIYKAGGNEYQRLNDIKQISTHFILPVNFPEAFDVEDYYDAQYITLAELKHWELAPSNPYAFYKNKLVFAFTTDGLKDKSAFLTNIKKAIQYGLPENEALKALTEIPAAILQIQDLVGTIDKNKLANFIITNQPLFTDKCVIHENWVLGNRYEIKPLNGIDLRGEYNLNINQTIYNLSVTGDFNAPTAEVKLDTVKVKSSVKKDLNTIALAFIAKDKFYDGPIRLSGTINYDSGSWDGTGQLPDGSVVQWTAIRKDKYKEMEIK